jgi:hypothetical protein
MVLKRTKEHFTLDKCTTHIKNILFGDMYIDHVGDMNFKNFSTGDTAVLTLKERGWNNKVIKPITFNIKGNC